MQKKLRGGLTHVASRLRDRRQRWIKQARRGNIIEPRDADVLGYSQADIPAQLHCTNRHQIVRTKERRYPRIFFLKKLSSDPVTGSLTIVAGNHGRFVRIQAS